MHTSEIPTLFIVTAPSGTGKTTLLKKLLSELPNLTFSVSHTTRPPRIGEADGVDYFFVTVEAFESIRENGDFLEWANVHGNYYATSRVAVFDQLKKGMNVVLDIDVAGAEQVRRKVPDAVSIFIMPPDLETLKGRLVLRNQDTIEVIETRLANASAEMEKAKTYDYKVINDDFERCYRDFKSIFMAKNGIRQSKPLFQ